MKRILVASVIVATAITGFTVAGITQAEPATAAAKIAPKPKLKTKGSSYINITENGITFRAALSFSNRTVTLSQAFVEKRDSMMNNRKGYAVTVRYRLYNGKTPFQSGSFTSRPYASGRISGPGKLGSRPGGFTRAEFDFLATAKGGQKQFGSGIVAVRPN